MIAIPPRQQETNENGVSLTISKAVALAIITLLGSVLTGYYAGKQPVGRLEEQVNKGESQVKELKEGTERLAANSLGSLEKGQKLCRVLQGKAWRDGLIVPQNWTVTLCVDYMKKTGGNGYQLGCISADGTNLGREDGSLPSPNCGWQ